MTTKKLSSLFIVIFFIIFSDMTNAQSSVARSSYFLDNAPYKHVLNPALAPSKGYISMPVLGSFDIDISSNLGLKSFLYPAAVKGDPLRTFMHPDISTNDFMRRISNNNFMEINNKISLLGFGFYTGDMFWNFEVASRIHADMSIPKDFFLFMKETFPYDEDVSYILDNIGVDAHMMVETAFGSSFNITDDIRVGAKAKLLLGGAKAYAGMEQMQLHVTPNNPNEKVRLLSNGGINLHMKGLQIIEDEDEGGIESFTVVGPGISGVGFGADLGAVWRTPVDFLTVSMGVTDLGFLHWGNQHNISATGRGEATYNGIMDFVGQEDPDSIPFFNQLTQMAMLEVAEKQNSVLQGLRPKVTIGAEADWYENKYTAGLLISNRLSMQHWVTEISAIANVKPIHHVNFAANFTVLNTLKGVLPSIGAALALDFYAGNIFLACDYFPLKYSPQFIPLNPVNTNIQLGFNWSIGKKKTMFPDRTFDPELNAIKRDNKIKAKEEKLRLKQEKKEEKFKLKQQSAESVVNIE